MHKKLSENFKNFFNLGKLKFWLPRRRFLGQLDTPQTYYFGIRNPLKVLAKNGEIEVLQ
jgi:hypothetical protein